MYTEEQGLPEQRSCDREDTNTITRRNESSYIWVEPDEGKNENFHKCISDIDLGGSI